MKVEVIWDVQVDYNRPVKQGKKISGELDQYFSVLSTLYFISFICCFLHCIKSVNSIFIRPSCKIRDLLSFAMAK